MPSINVGQTFPTATANFVDAKKRPAKVDPNKPLVWASSDETQIVAVVAPDGTAVITPVAPPADPANTARVTCTGDADLGDGFEPVTLTSEEITVLPDPNAKASGGTISLGTPVDIP